MLKGRKQLLGIARLVKHVAKDHDHGALMDTVCYLMNGFGGRGSTITYRIIDGFLQVGEHQTVVRSTAFAAGMGLYGFVEKAEPKGIALLLKQVH